MAAIVVAFCCAGSVILPRVAQRVMGAIDSAVAPARDAAGGYLYALRAGDYPAAYGQLCEEARKATSLETFTQAQSARPLVRYEILGTQIQNRNGRSSATVTAKLSYSDQGSSTQLISLVEEDGGWRVCG